MHRHGHCGRQGGAQSAGAGKAQGRAEVLDKLDPAILIGERFGLWPADQETVNVRTLAGYFTQLTHLPRLLGASVLPECLAKGVQRGLFAYALGDAEKKQFDTILFNDPTANADRCEITDSAFLLRPALAKKLLPEPKPVTGGTRTDGTATTTVQPDVADKGAVP